MSNSLQELQDHLSMLTQRLKQREITAESKQLTSEDYFSTFSTFFKVAAGEITAAETEEQKYALINLIVTHNNLYMFPLVYHIKLPADLDDIAYDFDHDEYPGNEYRLKKIIDKEYKILKSQPTE
jgi:hypothetical protein